MSGTSVLSSLVQALGDGSVRVVDIGATLNEQSLVLQLPAPFANTPGLKKFAISEFDDKGPGWAWYWYEVGEHAGTHFDAPSHWITGRHLASLDTLDPSTLIGPAVVVDITAEAAENPDFTVSREALLAWESRHGRIPDRAWVLIRSGWADKANDAQAYLGVDDQGSHWPGMGATGATFLTQERNILGVGVETIGTDAGQAHLLDPPYPAHALFHGAGRYGLQCLANLDQLPPTGSVVVASPLKIEGGSGSPLRVLAFVAG